MNIDIAFVLILLVIAIASFLLERIPPDQTAISILGVLAIAAHLPIFERLPSIEELLTVFGSPAPMTIASMFVVSAALEKTGVIESISSGLARLAGLGYRRFLFILMLVVAVISAFINNTPVVMVFLPAVLSLSRSLGVPASKMLIPLSYASIFGGACTLVGTSTNILASSILIKQGSEPIGMFELGRVGLPLLLVGCVYLTLFADRLLPDRETLTSLLSTEDRKEFLTEAFIGQGSPLVGKSVAQSGVLKGKGIRLHELIRGNVRIPDEPQGTVLQAGDRLVLGCRASGVAHARSIEGLVLASTQGLGLETISAHEGAIVEGIIGPRSTLVGQTVREIGFRQRFRVILIAIHRRGVNLREKVENVALESGDLLLLMGTDQAIEGLRSSDDVFLLDHAPTPSRSMRRKAPWVVAIAAGVILAAALNIMPIAAAALAGVAALLATGSVTPKEGYAAIEWSILILIFGMLGLGMAMQTSGAADLLARGLETFATASLIPPEAAPYVALAALYLSTMVMTETLSNNATVVLMTPIALSLGVQLGVDPRPFVVTTCLASSASFSTPIGYQTNTYVYGVAGYRFTDFTRIGLPLNLICFALSVFLIPYFWSF
ncbi:MAG: SLC13 family permease [Acidobacteriota bacterium]